ncbi:iron complex outermembrane recepter protein [Chitinophaga terrae (ex Kim and Jung 2007)]|uniref:Iron complex outermembrane recepter protein n=1 Tax=Chitinophaga terrae (ex Kim and Jung 2007) TaxID=408074 RepID=A0A1H4BRA8_9BACT|nr:TonB-dependent receptor [Chitinophaga terrae (ex Kim and Jung 2007)]GEP89728.1 TonB-dependent receptor [Chitinophaga terrae (ex Kim and Jung 2007)]SEA50661.1 iron complex outermembrane recepter protein [Chitinophaga terrae (ex Kim and Jung 2007)]
MYRPLGTFPLLLLAAWPFHHIAAQDKAGRQKDTLSRKHLGEVVVSASRRPVTLDNVPSSVTVVTKKMLENDMAVTTDVTDILAREVPGMAPGAQTNSNVGQGLRGRSVLIMIDGIPQSSPLRNGEVDLRSIDPAVLERVEVLKGATAIYGNGATGGLINYITASPKGDKPISGRTSVNMTGGLVGLKNSVGGRFSQMLQGRAGKWEYMASGVYEQTGEYKDAKGKLVGPNYSLGETETWNGFAKVGYHINSRQKLQLMYNYFRSQQNSNYTLVNGDISKGIAATGILGKMSGVPTGSKGNHNVHLVYQADSLVGGTSLAADAYYESRDDIFYVSFGRFEGGDGQSHTLDKKKGLRLMLNSPLLNSGSFTGNLSYGADLLNDITSQPLVDGRIWVPEMNMLNVAPFAETQFALWNDLILKAGIRVEKVGVKVKDYTTLRLTNTDGSTITPAIDVKGGKLDYTATLFNAGIRYNRNPLFMPYFSFSQGFSVSDVGLALRDSKVNDIKKINTEAVLVNNYELGFVNEYKGLRFELSGFISTSKLGADMIFDPATGLFNVSRTPERIYGFEAALSYAATKNLDLSASYSYLEGKADTAKTGGSYNVYLNGRRIAPPKVTGAVTYRPVKDLEVRLQYLGVQGRDRFAKNSKGVYNGNEGAVKAYNLFNLNASYKLNPKTMFTLGIENLFNEDYFPARSQWFMQPGFYAKGRGASFNLGIAVTY